MNKVYITGDLHGQIENIKQFVEQNYDTHCFDGSDIMILLGDAGFNYYLDEKDDKLKEEVSRLPFTFFVIRGNHEERPGTLYRQHKHNGSWDVEMFCDNFVYVEAKYPKIKYAMDDPNLYKINNQLIAIYPGAYSVDKEYRLMNGWRWFKHEQLTEEERLWGLTLAKDLEVDLVLSHTAPLEFEPRDLFLSSINQSTVDKSMEKYLQQIHEMVDYKLWCWGHYHADRAYPPDEKSHVMLYKEIQDLDNLFKLKEKGAI